MSVTSTAHANANTRSVCKGATSVLAPIEDDLLKFIFELREQGFAVSFSAAVIQAGITIDARGLPTQIE